ncbi:MAG: hypothetical protein HUU46_13200 [Candidatus Hydrogenedentes bacterium]|nr:hypothetical protein [Candidatus Hydrogenedentota bacterium]
MRLKTLAVAASTVICLAVGNFAAAADDATPNADFYRYLFAFPITEVIHQADHFGIANGMMSVGIDSKAMVDIQGLYAPPFVSSDFRFTINLDGAPLKPTSGAWLPVRVTAKHGLNPVSMDSSINLLYGQRAALVSILVSPRDGRKTVQLSGEFSGTLDTNSVWEFARPASTSATSRSLDGNTALLTQGDNAIALAWGTYPNRPAISVRWDSTTGQWTCEVPVDPQNYLGYARFAIAIGTRDAALATAKETLGQYDADYANVEAALGERAKSLLDRVPRFTCDNKSLERLYYRSLVHALMNKWEVPEFKLNPYYSTGSVKGGCVCNYLWDFGEVWEILPMIDPEAVKAHIKHFLSVDLTKHFAFLPITGEGFGPWYMVNQEKIIGLIYHYVSVTGDTAFLNDTLNGRTILDHVIEHATYGDDAAKPVALIDYGESNSHLELRKDLKYNHVMPDLNGRRHNNFVLAAKLSETMGKPRPDLVERAEALKKVLHDELWDPQAKWFAFKNGKGEKELRYTCQMFKLFNSPVLTDDSLNGLLSHWNANEFLGDYGLHSLAKGDPAYDENDVDNGGPGACTCFAPQIMERLYKSGHANEADELLKRILWWGEKLPYWGDSLYADRPDYRKDTPLQCAIDGLTVAQMIIFGLFGITPNADGSITINPHLPPIAGKMSLHNVRLRGHEFDVTLAADAFVVDAASQTHRSAYGSPLTLQKK